jgi:hypothetical protein
MKHSKLRTLLVSVMSLAILNMGGMQAAQAAILDTGSMVQSARDADLANIQAKLARAEVRAQLDRYGVAPEAIEARLGTMNDAELAQLAERMEKAPAGGDGIIVLAGVVFIVLLILELVGVIDIFKRA